MFDDWIGSWRAEPKMRTAVKHFPNKQRGQYEQNLWIEIAEISPEGRVVQADVRTDPLPGDPYNATAPFPIHQCKWGGRTNGHELLLECWFPERLARQEFWGGRYSDPADLQGAARIELVRTPGGVRSIHAEAEFLFDAGDYGYSFSGSCIGVLKDETLRRPTGF